MNCHYRSFTYATEVDVTGIPRFFLLLTEQKAPSSRTGRRANEPLLLYYDLLDKTLIGVLAH